MDTTDSTTPQTILITGGTNGLGLGAARDIATHFPTATIILASRSGEAAAQQLSKDTHHDNIHFMKLDLSSLQQVRDFVDRFVAAKYPPLTNLLLNAGLQVTQGIQYSTDGVEMTFAVNHLGHFLLFQLLRPSMTPNARITVTASGVHDPAQKTGIPDPIYDSGEGVAHPDGSTPASLSAAEGRRRYATSKLCNVLFTYELERRLRAARSAMSVNAFDPGLMPGTALARDAPAVLQFVWNHILPHMLPVIRLAVTANTHSIAESGHALARLGVYDEMKGTSGAYLEGLRVIRSSVTSYDEQKQADLWDTSVKLVARNADEIAVFNQF